MGLSGFGFRVSGLWGLWDLPRGLSTLARTHTATPRWRSCTILHIAHRTARTHARTHARTRLRGGRGPYCAMHHTHADTRRSAQTSTSWRPWTTQHHPAQCTSTHEGRTQARERTSSTHRAQVVPNPSVCRASYERTWSTTQVHSHERRACSGAGRAVHTARTSAGRAVQTARTSAGRAVQTALGCTSAGRAPHCTRTSARRARPALCGNFCCYLVLCCAAVVPRFQLHSTVLRVCMLYDFCVVYTLHLCTICCATLCHLYVIEIS